MNRYTEKQFLRWALDHSIGLDDSHTESVHLIFLPDPDLCRTWDVPPEPDRRPHFLTEMLDCMDEWNSCFVWRPRGSWPSHVSPERTNDTVEFQILSGIGMPMGTADVVEFNRAEIDRLVTLLFSTTVFGWSVSQDLYVVPDNAQFIMKTSHHDMIHMFFRDLQTLERFTGWMRNTEFVGPSE